MQAVFDLLLKRRIGREGIEQNLLKRNLKKFSPIRKKLISTPFIVKLSEIVDEKEEIEKLGDFANRLRKKFSHLVVLGIGGSSLGAQTLVSALAKLPHRVLFLDNIDPHYVLTSLKRLPLKKTLVNAVSKSGETVETKALFSVLCERLKRAVGDDWRNHIIITTDIQKGGLRRLASLHNLTTLPFPSEIGGRFSVFTSAGLLPAAFAGVNIKSVIEGATRVLNLLEEPTAENDPAFLSAICDFCLLSRKNILVLFVYSSKLRKFSDWVAQLWAESLGKRTDVGQTPLSAIGVTDQHSLLQLFVDGPADKVYNFVEVKRREKDLTVPNLFEDEHTETSEEESLGRLFESELVGTRTALFLRGRPIMRIILDKISPSEIGALLQFFILRVLYLSFILRVNPFDQPGVEQGKRITRMLIGRSDERVLERELRSAVVQSECEDWSFSI
ncbi:MAG: glucose-6-phosphate isomerase [Planctomycetota bacterium]|nr:glucose-6-phosphate isomerase [Planctomycetota bacterium]